MDNLEMGMTRQKRYIIEPTKRIRTKNQKAPEQPERIYMRMLKPLLALTLACLLPIGLSASSVRGTALSAKGQPLLGGTLEFQLSSTTEAGVRVNGCGGGTQPTVGSGAGTILETKVIVRPGAGGALIDNIVGNDQINCGGGLGVGTFYHVTAKNSSGGIEWEKDFRITGATFNINTAVPLFSLPPSVVPFAILGNPSGNQTITQPVGTSLTITGTLNATITGTVTALAANPTDCSAGQYATTIAANGNLTCAQVDLAQLSGASNIAFKNSNNNFTTSQSVTGTVTATAFSGPLTGNVTGNVSGNAGTVTNGVYTTGSYADPSWITSIAASKVTTPLPLLFNMKDVSTATGGNSAAKILDACGTYNVVVAPNNLATGISPSLTDTCSLLDLRGQGRNEYGHYTTAITKNALIINQRWTAPNSDVANGSPFTNQTFQGMQVFVDSAKGGINTGTLGASTKSNYFTGLFVMNASTPGQHQALIGECIKYGAGDCFGLVGNSTMWGGSRPAFGDEYAVPISSRMLRGGYIFTGTVGSKSGNDITFSTTTYNYTLGAGTRWLINLSSGVYTAGTAQYSITTTVTGSGTAWNTLGAGNQYCFSLDADEVSGRKFVIPVASFTDATHLELTISPGRFYNSTAGAYHLYKCSETAEVVSNDKTGTTPSVPIILKLVDATNFSPGDLTELPVSHLWGGEAIKVVIDPGIRTTQSLTALGFNNQGVGRGGSMHNLIASGGNFDRILEFDSWDTQPSYLILMQDTLNAGLPTFWFGAGSGKTNTTYYVYDLQNADKGTNSRWAWNTAADRWYAQNTGSGNIAMSLNFSGWNLGVGAIEQTGTQLYVATTGTNKGLVVNGNTTGDVFDVQVSTATRFKVTNTLISTPIQMTSTLSTGTAPFPVSSTTKNTNFNADLLDGNDWAATGAIGTTTPTTAIFTTGTFNTSIIGATHYGGTASNDDLTLEGTSNGTKTSSYVIVQPTLGNVGIGTTTPTGGRLDIRTGADATVGISTRATNSTQTANHYQATNNSGNVMAAIDAYGGLKLDATYGGASISGAYIGQTSGQANSTGSLNGVSMSLDRLLGGSSRYTISSTNVSGVDVLFTGAPGPTTTCSTGVTCTITVDFNPFVGYTANTNTGYTYIGGMIAFSAFAGSYTENMQIEAYYPTAGVDGWNTIKNITGNTKNPLVVSIGGCCVYIKKLRFTYSSSTQAVLFNQIQYFPGNINDGTELSTVARYDPNDVYLGVKSWNLKDDAWVTRTIFNPRVANSGSAIAYTFDTKNSLTTTAKIASFKNSGTEVAFLDRSGGLTVASVTTGVNTVTFSATPTFDASIGNVQKITLTGNVTSSTLSNAAAGRPLYFLVCQDATGSRTFTWPSNVKGGMTIGSTASKCSSQEFIYDGTNAYALSSGIVDQ